MRVEGRKRDIGRRFLGNITDCFLLSFVGLGRGYKTLFTIAAKLSNFESKLFVPQDHGCCEGV